MEHKNPVIFLDIDGVLNQGGIESMGRIDADRLRAFCEFAKRTKAEIVISSYWRTKQILRTRIVAALARHGLQVSGWTPPPRDMSSKRRSEIKSYIGKHCVKTYVILDDIADTGDMRKRWIVTKNGITRADLDKARKIIEEQTTEK